MGFWETTTQQVIGSMKKLTGKPVPVTIIELYLSNTRGQQIHFFDVAILHVYDLTIGTNVTPGLENTE